MRKGIFTSAGYCLVVLSLATSPLDLLAQDTLFISAAGDTVHSIVLWERYVVMTPDPDQPGRMLGVEHDRTGHIVQEERTVINAEGKLLRDGTARTYREDGSVKTIINYAQGKWQRIQSFWPGGMPKRDDLYQQDSLISGRCYTEDGSELPYFPYLIEPEFKGGLNKLYAYLNGQARYPDRAFEDGIQGTVLTRFVIMKDGSIEQVEIVRGVSPDLDAEALRVVRKMPAWSPGRIDGDPVKCRFNLPVVFKVQSSP